MSSFFRSLHLFQKVLSNSSEILVNYFSTNDSHKECCPKKESSLNAQILDSQLLRVLGFALFLKSGKIH